MVPWFPGFLEFVPDYLEMVPGYSSVVPGLNLGLTLITGYLVLGPGYQVRVPGYLSLTLVTLVWSCSTYVCLGLWCLRLFMVVLEVWVVEVCS